MNIERWSGWTSLRRGPLNRRRCRREPCGPGGGWGGGVGGAFQEMLRWAVPAVLKGRWRGPLAGGGEPKGEWQETVAEGVAVVLGSLSHRPVLGFYLFLGDVELLLSRSVTGDLTSAFRRTP